MEDFKGTFRGAPGYLGYSYPNIIILLTFFFFPSFLFAKEKRYEYSRPVMGSPFRLVFYTDSDQKASEAAEQVFQHLNCLNDLLSDYLDGSEVNRLSALSGRPYWIKADPALLAILDSSLVLSKKTGGAFDPTIGVVVQVWRRASTLRVFPEKKEVNSALKRAGYQYLQIDRDNGLIKLKRPGMRLDFGGIGKGYAADEGVRLLKKVGITSAMVDAGGDLVLGNPPPGQDGWKISVSSGDPSEEDEVLTLSNCGVATSGATYRYFEYKGKKYSHIVDPRTGVGLTRPVRATVIAPSGTQADALATSLSIVGLKGAAKLKAAFPQVSFRLLDHELGRKMSL